jgi:glutamate synthase (NADPH/NADH)
MDEIYGPEFDQTQETTNVFEYQETPENRSWANTLPLQQGLYDPENEKDACGVGFAA